MEPVMAPKTRLDALIGVLESREDWLQRTLVHLAGQLKESREEELRLGARIAGERPAANTVDEFRSSEQRVERLRVVLGKQQAHSRKLSDEHEKARTVLEQAHRRTQTMIKAGDRLRAGIVLAQGKAEAKELDELALLSYQRAG
jgi:flagellar biosynthesis chaperone FliJ